MRLDRPTPLPAALMAVALSVTATPAVAYDMDCKLILCAAGGFPDGCEDARAYMIRRITATPPQPPIGHCPIEGGGTYDDYDAELVELRGEERYTCPEDYALSYRRTLGDDGRAEESAFCQRHAACEPEAQAAGTCEPGAVLYAAATRDTHSIRITIALDGPDRYESDRYRFSVFD